ncbi:hypothetical protein FQZ97_986070 [compost metagenome]
MPAHAALSGRRASNPSSPARPGPGAGPQGGVPCAQHPPEPAARARAFPAADCPAPAWLPATAAARAAMHGDQDCRAAHQPAREVVWQVVPPIVPASVARRCAGRESRPARHFHALRGSSIREAAAGSGKRPAGHRSKSGERAFNVLVLFSGRLSGDGRVPDDAAPAPPGRTRP